MTSKQAQCLLHYLGYYVGDVDGKWSTLSDISLKAFQADFGMEVSGIVDKKTAKALTHAVTYGMPIREDK